MRSGPRCARNLLGRVRQTYRVGDIDQIYGAAVTDRALVSLLRSAMRELRADAIAIGAAVGDSTEFVCRGSLADEPVTRRTVFYGASVTKQIVGVAAARARARGLIAIDDSIVRWVPELPGSMEVIQVGHLIHHTSGLPDVADPAGGVPGSNADMIQRFQRLETPDLEPGVRYAYNNAGYVLLAEAVARSLHLPIAELAGELFTHLDLPDTRLGGPVVPLAGRPDPPGTIGDGGLWTSVRDLTRWLQACNEAAFGLDVQRLAESTTALADGSPLDYAWGVRVTASPAGRVITHGGSWDRWLAKTVRIPDQRVAVAILSVGAAELDISRTGTDLATAIASR